MNVCLFNYIKLSAIVFYSLLLLSCTAEPVKKVVEKSPEKPNMIIIDSGVVDQFNQAVVELKAGNYDKAIELLEKVIEIEKRVPAPYVNLSMAYEKKADLKKAEVYLLNALKIELTHPVANNQLGLMYRKQGRFTDARKAYTNALTKHPDYLPVVKNLGILCELYLRDFQCAMQQYEHYLSLQPDDKTMKIWISDLSQRL